MNTTRLTNAPKTREQLIAEHADHYDYDALQTPAYNGDGHGHGHGHGHSKILRGITKKARIKFRNFHRDTLKQFHEKMKQQHKKSVKSRIPTPVANAALHQTKNGGNIPAYLQ